MMRKLTDVRVATSIVTAATMIVLLLGPIGPASADDSRVERVVPSAAQASRGHLGAAVDRVLKAFGEGRRAEGEALIAKDESLASFDALPDGVALRVRFSAAMSGVLEVIAEKGDDRPLAIFFPPGTYADPTGGGRRTQQLSVIAGRALILGPDARHARRGVVQLPVACASFGIPAPRDGRQHVLRRFAAGTPIDRLMEGLFTDEDVRADAAQLAIWIVRDQISPRQLARRRGGTLGTFGFHPLEESVVQADDGPGAFAVITRSGLDATVLPFFAAEAPSPSGSVEREPKASPTPTTGVAPGEATGGRAPAAAGRLPLGSRPEGAAPKPTAPSPLPAPLVP